MALSVLTIDGTPAWQLDYYLPILWPFFFEPESITESRKLYTPIFDAAERHVQTRQQVQNIQRYRDIWSLFEELSPDYFPREMKARPDSIMALELARLEEVRPFQFEVRMAHWRQFLAACQEGNSTSAQQSWEEAALNPLRLTGMNQNDARALSARAQEFGLAPEDRASGLMICLMGTPVSPAARALHHLWRERAEALPPCRLRKKKPWWPL